MTAQQPAISPLAVIGSVAAAATTGALLAFGHRLGSAGIPFAEVSSVILRRTPSGGEVGLVFAGLVLHIIAAFVWTLVFLWIVRLLGWRPLAAALLIAVLQFCLSWLVARGTGTGLGTLLPFGDRLVLAVVLALSLVVGMRFALSLLRNA